VYLANITEKGNLWTSAWVNVILKGEITFWIFKCLFIPVFSHKLKLSCISFTVDCVAVLISSVAVRNNGNFPVFKIRSLCTRILSPWSNEVGGLTRKSSGGSPSGCRTTVCASTTWAMQIGTVCSNENASNVSIVIIAQVLESQRNRGMYGSVSLDRRVSLPWTIIDRVGWMPGWMLLLQK